MIRKATLLSLALALLVAAPAFSGGDHKKCSYNTQDCLNYMATKFKSKGSQFGQRPLRSRARSKRPFEPPTSA